MSFEFWPLPSASFPGLALSGCLTLLSPRARLDPPDPSGLWGSLEPR